MEKIERINTAIAAVDQEAKKIKIRGNETLNASYVNGSWTVFKGSDVRMSKGRSFAGLQKAVQEMQHRQPANVCEMSTLVLIKSHQKGSLWKTVWIVAEQNEIQPDGCTHYDTLYFELSNAEYSQCSEKIALYDGYYLYPLTRQSHGSLGRILNLSGQFNMLDVSAVPPVGLGLCISESLTHRESVNLVYSDRQRLPRVRPLTGLQLVNDDQTKSHEQSFRLLGNVLSAMCIWGISSYKINEESIQIEYDITYPIKAHAVYRDGLSIGAGISLGIDIITANDNRLRAGEATYKHSTLDETVFKKIRRAMNDAEKFYYSYQNLKDRQVTFKKEYAKNVFKVLGKRKTKDSDVLPKSGTIESIVDETADAYASASSDLSSYKEGKLYMAYADEARAMMQEVH